MTIRQTESVKRQELRLCNVVVGRMTFDALQL